MPPYPLTSFETKTYYKDEPRFNGVYSCDNSPKTVKDGAYVLNLHEYANIGTYWIALHVLGNDATYFNSFMLSTFVKGISVLLEIINSEYKSMI